MTLCPLASPQGDPKVQNLGELSSVSLRVISGASPIAKLVEAALRRHIVGDTQGASLRTPHLRW
jgi:hypothetical protein